MSQASNLALQNQELTWRIFPPRYSDPASQAEFELSNTETSSDAISLAASLTLSSSIITEKERLSVEEALSVVRDANKVRLMLAEILKITEESYEPPSHASKDIAFTFDVYNYLGWIISELTDVISI